MNKMQYLRILDEQLRVLPEAERADALAFVREYFEESGLEEWEVARQLGSPYDYARTICQEVEIPPVPVQTDSSKNRKNPALCWIGHLLVLFFPVLLALMFGMAAFQQVVLVVYALFAGEIVQVLYETGLLLLAAGGWLLSLAWYGRLQSGWMKERNEAK